MRARIIAASLTVSAAGVLAIATHEGKSNAAYQDPAHGWGVPTVCYGHTATAKPGQRRTDAECSQLLQEDTAHAAAQVRRLVKQPLTQGEFDAYTSFVFNVGQGKFANSTMLRKLNEGAFADACSQLLRWDYAGGKRLAGLTKRRQDEYKTCMRDIR
jgi:lysozyme